jgi:hypothetical protein
VNAYERELRRQFEPDYQVVKSRRGHYKIYDQAGCMITSCPGSPGEHHYMVNAIQEVRRHRCPARRQLAAIEI